MPKPKFRVILIISSIVILLCSTSLEYCESLRFDLPSGSTKCISEDIKKDGMTVGKYSVINPNPYPNFNIDLRPNPSGNFYPIPNSHRITARVCVLLLSLLIFFDSSPFSDFNNFHFWGFKVKLWNYLFSKIYIYQIRLQHSYSCLLLANF